MTTVSALANNISRYPASISAVWHNNPNLSFVGGYNNPSVCLVMFDPVAGKKTIRCDCAEGYFGIEWCEPLSDFLPLSSVVTTKSGLHINSSLLVNETFNANVIDPHDAFGTQTFAVPFLNGTYNISFITMFTVFWSCISLNDTFQPTTPQRSSSISTPLVASVDIPRGAICPFLVIDLSFSCAQCDSELPQGLSFSSVTGTISGTPTKAGRALVNITAHDSLSGDASFISTVNITIEECGPLTCLNGGVCDSGTDRFDNVYKCTCTANYTGSQCQQFQSVISADASTQSGLRDSSTIIIIAVLSGFAALLIIGGVIFFKHRLKQTQHKPFDFEQQMKELMARGLILDPNYNKVVHRPLEIKRSRVQILETLGSGAFGDVHKVCLDFFLFP